MAKKDAKVADKSNPKPKKANPAAPAESGDSFSAGTFVKGTQEELAKVIWPSRQQLISESAAVILMVSLSATLIYFIDKLFGWGSQQIF